jgi:hypothetical protein
MEHQRFALDWDHPSLPDAATHVSLFDGGKAPLNIVASGHGAGEAHALSDLLAPLKERRESPEAIAFAWEEYHARSVCRCTGEDERTLAVSALGLRQ